MAGFEIEFATLAENDLIEICEWYEQKKKGLSNYFINQFENSLNTISNRPESFGFVFSNKQLRKFHLQKFPYKSYYFINKNTIQILTIIHTKRSNNFIKKRIK